MTAVSSQPSRIVVSQRLCAIDWLRAVAANLLVWHHLCFYGPLADVAYPLAPVLLDWLADPARYVVQVFLVVGGFGTAQHLARLPAAGWQPFGQEILRRYCRIGIPYIVTLPVAICANAVAARWMDHVSISAAPTLSQFVAHVFFAQDLLHYEPLSAGIWYLAIDFQLFLCVVATAMLSRVWVDRCGATGGPAGSLAGAAAPTLQILAVPAVMSLFWWNRNPSFDCWGFYYLSSYFLGMLVQGVISGSLRVVVLWGYLGLIVVAVAVDWRPRLLVAAGAALVILMASKLKQLPHWSGSRVVGYLGEISFSLFLIHFPACLLVNAWLTQWPLTPTEAFAGMVAAWGASLILAVGFYHLVERPSWWRWRWSTTGGAPSWLVREEAGKPPATLPGQPTRKE